MYIYVCMYVYVYPPTLLDSALSVWKAAGYMWSCPMRR